LTAAIDKLTDLASGEFAWDSDFSCRANLIIPDARRA